MHTFVAAVALSVVGVAQAGFSTETIHKESAPILSHVDAEVVPDSYIIKFKDHVNEAAANDHHSWIQSIHKDGEEERLELRKRSLGSSPVEAFAGLKHTYNIANGFKGYSGHFHESVIEKVRNHGDVSLASISMSRASMMHKTSSRPSNHC